MFKIYIHHSKDLLGQTGDNGETVCVFLEHPKNTSTINVGLVL